MPITKAKKVEVVAELKDKIKAAEAIAFVNFLGLSVAAATELRKALRAAEVGLMVAKKTLIRRAFDGSGISGEVPELPGEIALAYGTDALAPAREVYAFEKKNKDVVKLVGGVYEGAFVSSAFMMELATIPSREVLLSKLVFLLKSPIQRLAVAINEVSKTKTV
jgi:large subunit ribosomal protein L10